MTSAFETALLVAPKIVAAAARAARRDLSADYGLLEDWELPALVPALRPPDYEDDAFRIRAGRITVRAYAPGAGICDGCSLSPDDWAGLKTAIGALFHDRWYGRLEALSAAWGWPAARVRALGDRIFLSILLAEAERLRGWRRPAASATAEAYYLAVRAFGGIYHRAARGARAAARLAALCAGLALLPGCGGCAGTAFERPGDYAPPAYTNASPYAAEDGAEALASALREMRGSVDAR